MALRHRSFLLNEQGFLEDFEPIKRALELGDARPLYHRALGVVRSRRPEDWVLESVGTRLLDIERVDFVGVPWRQPILQQLEPPSRIPPFEIGYWLLLLLSDYLTACPGIGVYYPVLWRGLTQLGWSDTDRDLLLFGKALSSLINPTSVPVDFRSEEDPYWHWMVPSHANKSGWLTREQITYLRGEVLSTCERAQQHGVTDFHHESSENESALYFQQEELSVLRLTLEAARAMLDAASDCNSDLYLVISD